MMLSFGLSLNRSTFILQPPELVSAVTNTDGTVITLTFNKAMANPAGKQAQFSATIAGSSRPISSVALNADNTRIDLTISGAAIANGNTVTVSYTAGDVAASDTSPLASFSGQSVTNNVASLYQQWSGYPQTPELSSVWPYQCIVNVSGTIILFLSKGKIYGNLGTNLTFTGGEGKRYLKTGSNWTDPAPTTQLTNTYTMLQCNYDIYTNSSFTTILYAKTTP